MCFGGSSFPCLLREETFLQTPGLQVLHRVRQSGTGIVVINTVTPALADRSEGFTPLRSTAAEEDFVSRCGFFNVFFFLQFFVFLNIFRFFNFFIFSLFSFFFSFCPFFDFFFSCFKNHIFKARFSMNSTNIHRFHDHPKPLVPKISHCHQRHLHTSISYSSPLVAELVGCC